MHEPFLREQRLRRGVFRLIRKTGGFIWIDTIARPVFDKDGSLSAMQGAGRDITAAKLAEKELIRSRSEHQALNERLINELEAERLYLSREIHDGFSQEIAALIIETERFVSTSTGENRHKAQTMVTQLRKLAEDMHRVARRLHPSILTDLGLPAALRAACNGFVNQTGIPVEFKLRSFPEAVPEKIALCLYRVAEEALQNIRKHARASAEVKVLLSATPAQLLMTIKDIGDGFDPGEGSIERRAGSGEHGGESPPHSRIAFHRIGSADGYGCDGSGSNSLAMVCAVRTLNSRCRALRHIGPVRPRFEVQVFPSTGICETPLSSSILQEWRRFPSRFYLPPEAEALLVRAYSILSRVSFHRPQRNCQFVLKS